MNKDIDLTIEQALGRLEEIQAAMQDKNVELEDSVKLYEEAVMLYKYCKDKLGKLEQRVMILTKTADGELCSVEFEENCTEDESD